MHFSFVFSMVNARAAAAFQVSEANATGPNRLASFEQLVPLSDGQLITRRSSAEKWANVFRGLDGRFMAERVLLAFESNCVAPMRAL